jgi:hypothetical protein
LDWTWALGAVDEDAGDSGEVQVVVCGGVGYDGEAELLVVVDLGGWLNGFGSHRKLI